MTSGLRKAHKAIWLVLILMVPIVIVFAIKDLALFSSEANVSSQFETSKEKILMVAENDLLKASIIAKDSKNYLELILKSPLKNSSALVYTTTSSGDKIAAIGQLSTVGIYNLSVREKPKGILLYDGLKEVEITKISF
jgi:hypothetical protein